MIQSMRDNLASEEVDRYSLVDTHTIITDLLRKDSADPELFMLKT